MKAIVKLSILLIISLLVLTACETSPNFTEPEIMQSIMNIKSVNLNQSSEYPLWAGQNIDTGNLYVSNDAQNLYVSYVTENGWKLKATHMHVATSLAGIPKNKQGVPVPGKFAFSSSHNPYITEYTYQIPLSSLGLSFGQNIVVAAHAEVLKERPDGSYQQETAFGGNVAGPGNRWWYYATYTIVQPQSDDDPVFNTETAMLRMNDVPNDFSYRWGTHPWFSYVKHAPSTQPQTFYFYAGQHYRVGEAQVWKDASFLYVQIDLDNPYEMTESHLNVQLQGYSGTPSFGLFPYKANHTPKVSTYQYKVPFKSEWVGQNLSIALHGVVGPF